MCTHTNRICNSILFLLIAAVSLQCSSQGYKPEAIPRYSKPSRSDAPGPIFHIVEGPEFDLGTLTPERHDTTFHIANIGSDTLIINYFKSSCGCMTGNLSKYIIPPGDTVTANVSFDVSHRSGTVHKSFLVSTNQPDFSRFYISVLLTVVNDIELHPTTSYMVLAGSEGKGTGTIRLKNVYDSTITITQIGISPEASSEGVKITHNYTGPITLKPEEEFELTVNIIINQELNRPWYRTDGMTIRTTGPYHPELHLTLVYYEGP